MEDEGGRRGPAIAGRFRPVTPRLDRRRVVDRAWQRYVQEGLEPTGLAEEIARSWRRARELHRIDPGITRPGRVLSPEGLAARRQGDEVFRLATPVLADFARRLGLHDAVLAYLDGDGWMLSIDGDRGVVEQVEEIDFRPGALWAEEVAGTNGPGTALVERKPVEVFASEHFVSAWHPWTCAAAPIQAPGEERPLGVVDLSGPWEVHRRHALLIAKAIARAIEERLRALTSVRHEVVRYAFRAAHEAGDALVATDARGRVIAANDAAVRRRLVLAGALAGAAREGFLGVLRSPALGLDPDVRLETSQGETLVASRVCYEGATIGTILRVASPAAAKRRSRERERRPAAGGELADATVPEAAACSGPRALTDGCRGAGEAPLRSAPCDRAPSETLRNAVLESERDALLAALEAASWNFARAAEQLGVSRMTLYRRLQRHGISRTLACR